MKALLVAEKPSAMKDIEKAYIKNKSKIPYDIDFACCAGHLLTLYEPEDYKAEWGKPWNKEVLPIIPTEWKTKVINHKYFNNIKNMYEAGNYDVIINAGDAGREGQLIQERVYEALGVDIPILRYWAEDGTEETVVKTLNKLVPNEQYKGLSEASKLRAYLDQLIGVNFSRASTLSTGRTCRVGRVITPTLKMVCDREKEITNFKPIPFFELKATFSTLTGEDYVGYYIVNDDKAPTPYAFLNSKKPKELKNHITYKNGFIKEVIEDTKHEKAPKLFNLTDLQKECSKKNNFSLKETQDIAQSLYDKKFLSYPRTESKHITTEQAKEIPQLLNSLLVIEETKEYIEEILKDRENISKVLSSKKYVDNKKVIDHPALLPTTSIPNLSELSEKEKIVYLTVLKRLVAIFLSPYTYSTTTIISVAKQGDDRYEFKTTGRTEIDLGWKKLIKEKKGTVEKKLPLVKSGDSIHLKKLDVESKATTPPLRFTNDTLVSAMETAGKKLTDEELEKVLMECSGLGTVATRADIVLNLFEYNYVRKDKNYIVPTLEGMELIDVLGDIMVTSPELTARFEMFLRKVERQEMSFDNFYNNIIQYIKQATAQLLELKKLGMFSETIGKCPLCKERDFANYSKFYACRGFFEKNEAGEKTCSFALPTSFLGRKLAIKDIKTLIEGKTTQVLSLKKQDGTTFKTSLCLGYVDKKNKDTGEILGKELKITFPKTTNKYEEVGKCPLCNGKVLKGKGYFCENWARKDNDTEHLCEFVLSGKVGVTEVEPSQMREILEKGETAKEVNVKFDSGKHYKGILYLDMEKHWIGVKAVNKNTNIKCSCCENGVIFETQYRYECSNFLKDKSCDFSIPKTYCHAPITHEELRQLIPIGQRITKKNLVSQKGSLWEGSIKIRPDIKYGYVYDYKD